MARITEDGNTQPPANSEVVSTSEAARQLGVSVRTIQLWVESGKLEAWKTAGQHRRVYQRSIDNYKSARSVGDGKTSKEHYGEYILVIEDDRTTQVYYETMLQLLEVESDIELVSNGLRGLLAIGKFEPWLVIVDIEMPELDGIEVVMAMRQKGLSDQVRIVAISNVPYEEALERGLPADCAFYQKPISLDDFSQAIAQARADYESSK